MFMSPQKIQPIFTGASYGARPDYPAEFIKEIIELIPNPDNLRRLRIWDCGTGPTATNVRALTQVLEPQRFPNGVVVHATDFDWKTVKEARGSFAPSGLFRPGFKIDFGWAAAEVGPRLKRGKKLSAILGGNTAHWWDMNKFGRIAYKLCEPDALIAIWTHQLRGTVDDRKIQEAINRIDKILEPYQVPRCRDYVTGGYSNLIFPFEDEITLSKKHVISKWMDIETYVNYVESLLTAKIYQKETGCDVKEMARNELKKAWGDDPSRQIEVRWDLDGRFGRAGSYNGPGRRNRSMISAPLKMAA